jgi:hypothetical protein
LSISIPEKEIMRRTSYSNVIGVFTNALLWILSQSRSLIASQDKIEVDLRMKRRELFQEIYLQASPDSLLECPLFIPIDSQSQNENLFQIRGV